MERRAAKVGPWRVAVAVAAVAVFVILTAGMASAADVPGRSPVLSISSDRVTLTLPIQGCPHRRPDCVWMLAVNESASGKVVGTATGPASAVALTVALPAYFCGVVQADALIGPSPWRKVVGHRSTVQTSASCSLPFTAATTGTTATAPAPKLTQLPFTGIDVKPLTIVGVSLTLLGLLMATDFDRRRKEAHRPKEWTWSESVAAARNVARWLFGD